MIDQRLLIDKYGRELTKLRVSLTDACNFQCVYCMPEKRVFFKQKQLLYADEFYNIVSNLNKLGINEVRLTGGEPTLRKDFLKITKRLSDIPLKKFALTTNAYRLDNLLVPLATDTNLKYLNISMDSLNKKNFEAIAGVDFFDKVYNNIKKAKELGFNVKLNCVLMRGVNDNELVDFIKFAIDYDLNIRFLEVMNIGIMKAHFKQRFISSSDMINTIKEHGYTLSALKDEVDSTSFNFSLGDSGSIGFIASESKPFCSGCSRLRLSSTGFLRACLFKSSGYSIRDIPFEKYPEVLEQVKLLKPIHRIKHIEEPMYKIGG